MADKSIFDQIAKFLGVPVENVVLSDIPTEDELYGGPPGGDQPAATGELSAKIIRHNE